MTYADDEESLSDGEPVELYEFIGSNLTYRYTSSLAAVEYGGGTYAPATISRSNVVASTTNDPATLEVRLPSSDPLVLAFGFGNPPRSLQLKIYRLQVRSDEARVIWDGRVVAMAPTGRMAKVKSTSQVGDRLSTSVPSVSFQRLCNHFLYDARCRVERTTYDFTALVVSVSTDGKTVTVDSIGLAPDQWFRAGEVVRDIDQERRLIVSQVGAVLTLTAPFPTIGNGNGLTLYAGCDHSLNDCSDKFNNTANFGGHPSIPQTNPFMTPLRLIRR